MTNKPTRWACSCDDAGPAEVHTLRLTEEEYDFLQDALEMAGLPMKDGPRKDAALSLARKVGMEIFDPKQHRLEL